MRRVIVNSTPLIALCNADLVIIDDNAAKNSKISWINSNGHLRCSYKS